MENFVLAGRFKRWLSRPDCPEVLLACKRILDRAFGFTTPEDIDEDQPNLVGSTEVSTPPELASLIDIPSTVLSANYRHSGTIYSRSSTHLGNSLIIFSEDNSSTAPPIAASIQYIFKQADGHMAFAVRRQCPCPSNISDPFRHYPDFPARLYSTHLHSELEVVLPNQVFAHYARWDMSADLAVVLSLNLVRGQFCFPHLGSDIS